MSKHENFNDWYAEWTGSDVKCENLDVIGAWEYQQKRIQYLEKAYTNLKLQLENKEIDAGIDEKKINQLEEKFRKVESCAKHWNLTYQEAVELDSVSMQDSVLCHCSEEIMKILGGKGT